MDKKVEVDVIKVRLRFKRETNAADSRVVDRSLWTFDNITERRGFKKFWVDKNSMDNKDSAIYVNLDDLSYYIIAERSKIKVETNLPF